jgi:type 1 glutamine amidotransferase
MKNTNSRRGVGGAGILSILAVLFGGADSANAQTTAPKSNLKKVLVLDKSQGGANGHLESRRDLNAALNALATEKGFTVTFIGQNDGASKIATEFSEASLATYQAVIFSNNDGVHAQLNTTEKANLEAYVKNGGGFIPIHAASAFISNWSWITNVLVESFYGPHGSNQPTANVIHDAEGTKDDTETKGIFKGLTAPLAFLDEYYSFRATPRGKPGVSILLRVDESSFSKTVQGPMGSDHPVVWSKTDGKGRVVHLSMGHSWSTNNVYTAKNNYLKNFLYGTLRYVAGDFVGCTDNKYKEYNPDATKSDQAACKELVIPTIVRPDGKDAAPLISREAGKQLVRVDLRSAGAHSVAIFDVFGRVVDQKRGTGPTSYALPVPNRSGIYTVVAKAGGEETRFRVTVL